LAALGMHAADRIADELLRVVSCLHHRGAAEERLAHGDTAPHEDALPLRRPFVGIKVGTHGGVDAVGADQDIAFGLSDRLAIAIDELRENLVAPLLEADDAMAELDPSVTQPPPGSVEQQHLQLAAMDR